MKGVEDLLEWGIGVILEEKVWTWLVAIKWALALSLCKLENSCRLSLVFVLLLNLLMMAVSGFLNPLLVFRLTGDG